MFGRLHKTEPSQINFIVVQVPITDCCATNDSKFRASDTCEKINNWHIDNYKQMEDKKNKYLQTEHKP